MMRRFHILLYALSLGLAGCQSKGEEKTSGTGNDDPRYNVIFLVVDDMNDFAVTGEEEVYVPNLLQLKKESVVFDEAVCAAPVCIPSRASFFTGISPHHSGVYLNGGDPWNDSEVLKNAETLAELFRRNGYYSYGRGKIYHKPLSEGRIEKNFDNRPIYEGGFGPFPDKEHRLPSGKDKFPKFWGVQDYPDSLFPDIVNTDAVTGFLSEDHEKPFFLTLGFWRPHTPFTAPRRFFELYDPEKITIPKNYKADDLDDLSDYAKSLLDPFGRFAVAGAGHEEQWKRFIHGYYACNSFVDWNIGRVMNALSSSRYADNTIVVVFSDNGFHLGTKNHWEKNTLWDASAIVPLAIRMPGGVARKVHAPVSLIDLYPTMVDLCRLDAPRQVLDGESLRPYLEGKKPETEKPAITYFGDGLLGIRSENYRYIRYPDGSEEFYDDKKDPNEWNNLINDPAYAELIRQHRTYIPDTFASELPGRRN